MSEENLEHIALAANNEGDSDEFFIELLGLEKTRSFTVSPDLMEKFFNVNKEQKVIRYEGGSLTFEVFITDDDTKAQDIFTHSCLLVENRDNFVYKANSMGYDIVKVPRKDGNGYYLFIKDTFQNLYEVKEKG